MSNEETVDMIYNMAGDRVKAEEKAKTGAYGLTVQFTAEQHLYAPHGDPRKHVPKEFTFHDTCSFDLVICGFPSDERRLKSAIAPLGCQKLAVAHSEHFITGS